MNFSASRWGGRAVLWAALCALPALLLSCGPRHPRLVLLIIVDTLRADHLHCYGDEAIATPNIDRLAGQGVLYQTAITAAPVTLPSISTILTGAYPAQHGVRDNGPYQLADRWTTLAGRLHQTGYATGAFVSAAVLSRDHRLSQGFDVYDDDVSARYVPYQAMLQGMEDGLQGIKRRGELTVDRALSWLQSRPEGDTFLLVHFFDAHLPQDPPPPFARLYPGSPYDGEIAYIDQQIGRLLDGIRRARRNSELMTIFVADHGEGLGSHEEAFHGDLLFDETVRVPLILQGPGIPRGRKVAQLVRTVDITPTICALLGLPAPEWSAGAPLPGIHSPGRWPARSEGRSRLAYLETFRPRLSKNWCELRGLRTDHWKLIDGPGYELYNLDSDPMEKNNLADSRPEVRDSLITLMDQAALGAVRRGAESAASLAMSQEQREKLQSLGYITPREAHEVHGDSLAVWVFPPRERGRALGLPNPRERLAADYQRVLANSFYQSGEAALRSGDLAQAEQRFEIAIEHSGAFAPAYLGLAEAEERAGHADSAGRCLEEAQSRLPRDPDIAVARAEVLASLGHVQEALRLIDQEMAVDRGDPRVIETRRELQQHLKHTRPPASG